MMYHPNCTIPLDSVPYVGSSNVRSTLDILWTSLATTIACTYSVLHLNVPEALGTPNAGWRADLAWRGRQLLESLKWTVIACLAPEAVLAYTFWQWLYARSQLRKLHDKVPETRDTWTLTHMLFASMGGFVASYGGRQKSGPNKPPTTPEDDVAVESGKAVDRPSFIRLPPRTLRTLVEEGVLAPTIIPADEIMDKSKSDVLTKSVSMAQILYFVLQVAVRAGRGLPISQLELGVAGGVTCSVLTYCFVMRKPKSVTTATVVHAFTDEEPPSRLVELWKAEHFDSLAAYWHSGQQRYSQRFGNDLTFDRDNDWVVFIVLTLAGIILGAVHLAGWDYTFPTYVDAMLWRVAALVSITAFPAYFCLAAVLSILDSRIILDSDDAKGIVLHILFATYGSSRLVLIVEMFRCLFYLPPEAFLTTWTSSIPHIG